MHYYLCPRCNFKIAEKKRLCTTCGFRIPKPEAVDDGVSGVQSSKRGSFFSRFFGMRPEDNNSAESGKEKPALS